MPIPFDLNNLDGAWQGQPCVANTTTGSIELASLDCNAAGRPFIANNGPLNQSAAVNSQECIVGLGEVSISTSGGGVLLVELESGNEISNGGGFNVSTVAVISLSSVDVSIDSSGVFIATTIAVALYSGTGVIQSNAIALTTQTTLGMESTELDISAVSAISLSQGSVLLTLETIDTVASSGSLSLPAAALTIFLEGGCAISNVGAVALTPSISIALDPTVGKLDSGVIGVLPGAVLLQLAHLAVNSSTDGFALFVYFKSNVRATWGTPETASVAFGSQDRAVAALTLREEATVNFDNPAAAVASWGSPDTVTIIFSVDEYF